MVASMRCCLALAAGWLLCSLSCIAADTGAPEPGPTAGMKQVLIAAGAGDVVAFPDDPGTRPRGLDRYDVVQGKLPGPAGERDSIYLMARVYPDQQLAAQAAADTANDGKTLAATGLDFTHDTDINGLSIAVVTAFPSAAGMAPTTSVTSTIAWPRGKSVFVVVLSADRKVLREDDFDRGSGKCTLPDDVVRAKAAPYATAAIASVSTIAAQLDRLAGDPGTPLRYDVEFEICRGPVSESVKFPQNNRQADEEEMAKLVKTDAGVITSRKFEESHDVLYGNAGYVNVAAGAEINRYLMPENVPSSRQICGGFALARLFGGPYRLRSDQAKAILIKFAEPLGQGKPITMAGADEGDVVMWGNAEHFAVVLRNEGPAIRIATKNKEQRAYIGELARLPEFTEFKPEVYRLNWDAIDVRRKGDPVLDVPVATGVVDWLTAVNGNADGAAPRPRDQAAIISAINQIAAGVGQASYRLQRVGVGSKSDRGGSWQTILQQDQQTATGKVSHTTTLRVIQYPTAGAAAESRANDAMDKLEIAGQTILKPHRDAEVDIAAFEAHPSSACGSSCMMIWRCGWFEFLIQQESTTNSTDPAAALPADTLRASYQADAASAQTMMEVFIKFSRQYSVEQPERPVGYPGVPAGR